MSVLSKFVGTFNTRIFLSLGWTTGILALYALTHYLLPRGHYNVPNGADIKVVKGDHALQQDRMHLYDLAY